MSFYLSIHTNFIPHPSVRYSCMAEGLSAIYRAIDALRFTIEEEDFLDTKESAQISIVTGPGTIYRLVSEERAKELQPAARERMSRLQQGLIAPGIVREPDKEYSIVLQFGATPYEPNLDFESREAAEKKLSEILNQSFFEHYYSPEDLVVVEPPVGMITMLLTKTGVERRRRMIIEQIMRQKAAAQAANNPLQLPPGFKS